MCKSGVGGLMISSCRPSPLIYQFGRHELRHTWAETLVITLRFYVWRSGADDVDSSSASLCGSATSAIPKWGQFDAASAKQ